MKNETVYIANKIVALADQHRVRPLLVVEAGSHAKGAASPDTAYDVRFLYTRSHTDYLAVKSQDEEISCLLTQDDYLGVEINCIGWDIRKALKASLRGNGEVHAWTVSPIRFGQDSQAIEQLAGFVRASADLTAYQFHYYKALRKCWQRQQERATGKTSCNTRAISDYCRATHLALTLGWLDQQGSLPPLDFPALLANPRLDAELRQMVADLIHAKIRTHRRDGIRPMATIDAYIEQKLANKPSRPDRKANEARHLDAANAVFQSCVTRN